MAWTGIRSKLSGYGWLVLAVGALAFIRALSLLLPYLVRDDLYTGDVCQHTWWMYRYHDKTLFPHDLIAEYFSLPFLSPAGYRAIVGTAARVLDAQHVVETLSVLLAMGAIALTIYLGHMIGRRAGAAAALVVLWATHAELLTNGGFPRSFGLLLILAGMIALLKKWWAAFGGVVLACALLYPPMLLSLFLPAATSAVMMLIRRTKPNRGFYVCVALSLVAGGIVATNYLRPPPKEIGPPFDQDQIYKMQEWHKQGRFVVLGHEPIFGIDIPNGGIGWSMGEMALGGAGLLLTIIFARRAIPAEGWALFIGAIALWAIACAVLFKLYFPDRYLMYACPVFGMIWAAGVVREWYTLLNTRALRIALPIAAIIFAVISLSIDIPEGIALYHEPGDGTTAQGYEAALKFIRTLPKNAMIAADPNDANAIPLRTRRSVLVDTEVALPIHTAYYAEMKRRLNDCFDLLYATKWETAVAIADNDHLNYFLLDKRRLTTPNDFPPYLRPYMRENERRIADGLKSSFALLSPPKENVVFQNGDMVLIQFEKPRKMKK